MTAPSSQGVLFVWLRSPFPVSLLAMFWLPSSLAPVQAQFTDRPLAGDVAQQRIEQLRLDDSVLRSEISSAQVARQVEITRLEGRILQLEEQLRDLPSGVGSQQLAYILGLAAPGLGEPQGTKTPAENAQITNDGAGKEEADKDEIDKSAEGRTETKSAAVSKEDKVVIVSQPSQVVQEIVVRDFVMSVEIELLDARVRSLEKNREVKSLERLSSKGLASAAQLELQIMQRRRAELQVDRLEKQLAGLRRVFPNYFDSSR